MGFLMKDSGTRHKGGLGIVAHCYNPSYAVGIGRRIVVQGWITARLYLKNN
jgi:hypothetical protein